MGGLFAASSLKWDLGHVGTIKYVIDATGTDRQEPGPQPSK